MPYQSNNISNTNIFTDSARNNDTSFVSAYSLNKLHVLNANISLVYRQKNFSFEAGIGITPVLSGDGKLEQVITEMPKHGLITAQLNLLAAFSLAYDTVFQVKNINLN